ncbi:MAG: acetamidase/formamidase family protein [Gemmatimonadales bacterium]
MKTLLRRIRPAVRLVAGVTLLATVGCRPSPETTRSEQRRAKPDFVLRDNQTHNKFSRRIAPALRVPSGSIIEAFAHEATGGQFTIGSSDPTDLNMDLVHTLTGPVYVEGAEPGDILAVELLEIEVGDWGWMAIIPGFGLLADDFGPTKVLRTFALDKSSDAIEYAKGIRVPFRPFAGVMGVAPATDEMLGTGPPRANGGNLDNPHLIVGTTVYFPVFVPGALFSIGDPHAAQGLGEVAGTGMESPMRFVYKIRVIKNGRSIEEVQYETDAYYATTGFATTLEEAAKKATRYMIDYLAEVKGLSREDAYMLSSLAGDLEIAEAVDKPNMLVVMHLPKSIFANAR